jgi:DNA-binding response OmpR family regulator
MNMSEKPFALIIEDDHDAATIFAEALKAAGFQVEIINDGQRDLDQVATPDVVVLDMHLPHVAGPDILRRIRGEPRLAKTRVIIATADPSMTDTLQDMADLTLLKPITFVQLRDLAMRLK